MTASDYPDACFNATVGNSGTQKARTGATAGRILSRVAIMLRIVRTFLKIFAARKYFIYLQRTTLSELCAADNVEDVRWRLRAYPGEIEKPDAAGLYPIHVAASNEHEDAPLMVEAILRSNRFAARQRSRDSQSLALHYTCRNVGPTRRQDTALILHTAMLPVCNRLVRILLDKNFGYPQGASRADIDGQPPPTPLQSPLSFLRVRPPTHPTTHTNQPTQAPSLPDAAAAVAAACLCVCDIGLGWTIGVRMEGGGG